MSSVFQLISSDTETIGYFKLWFGSVPQNINITKARLILEAADPHYNPSYNGTCISQTDGKRIDASVGIYRVSDNDWDRCDMTWDTRPGYDDLIGAITLPGSTLQGNGFYGVDIPLDFVLNAMANEQPLSIALVPLGMSGYNCYIRMTTRIVLIIEYEQTD